MRISKLFFLTLFLPALSIADVCETIKPINLDPYISVIGSRKVIFAVIDFGKNNCRAINPQGLTQRYSPYSTFKIPHTLIALETGAVNAIDERIEWNQIKHPAKPFWPEAWKQSQALASAFKYSTVWYYQELVSRVKPVQYKEWLAKFHYGNQSFTPDSDEFWLNGELKISALEQLGFLHCLLNTLCGVKPHTFSAFESIALQETKNGLSLYAKTGAGPIDPHNNDGAFEGWYVGYIKNEKSELIAAFATYVEADNFTLLKDFRKDFSLRLLTDLEFWKR